MATSGVSSDGTLPCGTDLTSTDTGAGENDSAPMSVDENGVSLSMGPLLPANPEDTTCYWYVSQSLHTLWGKWCAFCCNFAV